MRFCVFCDQPLVHRRSDARYCSGACKTEGNRLKAILSGEKPQGYRSVVQRMDSRRRGTKRLSGGSHSPELNGAGKWSRG